MNMPRLTRNELERLIASEGGPHLSLYLPPPVGSNDTLEEEKIRFGNLIRLARERLTRYWMPGSEADDFLRPLEPVLGDLLLVNPRRHAVAAFVSSQSRDVFGLEQELVEMLNVGRTFRIRPLLPCLDEPDPYVVATLSQQRVALYARTQFGLERVAGIVPECFEKIEAELTDEPQVRAAVVGGRGVQGVTYHGQGGIRDFKKIDLENYLRHVDDCISSYLRQHVGTRLILAGVDSLTAKYQAISHCDNMVKQTIPGNVDHLSVEELQTRAEAVAGRELHMQLEQKRVRIRERDVAIVSDPEQVLVAGLEGRIDTLFIDKEAKLNGTFLVDQRTLKEIHCEPSGAPDDCNHDMIELAAVQTIKNGGVVYAVAANEMPVAKRMVASLRY